MAAVGCTAETTEKPEMAKVQATRPDTGRDVKGKLPSGWESKNSEEFRALADEVVWTDPTPGERSCEDLNQCRRTPATIAANRDAKLITPEVAGTAGALVARMKLVGSYSDAMYKMAPGAFMYYVVVTSMGPKANMAWQLVQVGDNGKNPIKVIGKGEFYNCNHVPNPSSPAKADWKGCDSYMKTISMANDTTGGGDQPGWISCPDGCCTVSAAQLALRESLGRVASGTTRQEHSAKN